MSLISSVGVKKTEVPTLGVKISPNPVSDRILLEFSPSQTGDLHIRLLNVKGEVVFRKTETSSTNIAIHVGTYSPGAYFIQLEQNGIQRTMPVAISR